jgi:hypothetical protein
MKAEVLYIAGCANHQVAVDNLRGATLKQRCSLDVVQTEVHTPEQASELALLGSPSIRIEGLDIEPGARDASMFGLGCRTYLTPKGRRGAPGVDLIYDAIAEALPR